MWKYPIFFIKFITIMLVVRCLADSLSFLIHEFIGHGSVALLLGKYPIFYWLSLFGGAYLRFDSSSWSRMDDFLIYPAGWISVILASVLFVITGRRFVQNKQLSFYVMLTALTMLSSTFLEVTYCLYFGIGDGRFFYELLGHQRLIIILALLICVVACSAYYAHYICTSLQGWLPGVNFVLIIAIFLSGNWIAINANSILQSWEAKYNEPHALTDSRLPIPLNKEMHAEKIRTVDSNPYATKILLSVVWSSFFVGPLVLRRRVVVDRNPHLAPSWSSIGVFSLVLFSTWVIISVLILIRPLIFF